LPDIMEQMKTKYWIFGVIWVRLPSIGLINAAIGWEGLLLLKLTVDLWIIHKGE